MGLGIAAIGGKDSMSGSFEDLDVPPTLVSFATAIGNGQQGRLHRVQEAGEHRRAWCVPIPDAETGCPKFVIPEGQL